MTEFRNQKKRKNAILIVLLIISVSFLSFSTYNGFNAFSQNVQTASFGGYELNLTPGTVTVPSPLQGQVNLQLTIMSKHNFTNIFIGFSDSGSITDLINASVSPRKFFLADFKTPASFTGSGARIYVKIDNTTEILVPLKFEQSYMGLISDVLLFAGIGLFSFSLYKLDIKTRKYWLMLPVFALLSIIYGQRYDDYFMIALGARIADSVDPYVRSVMIPPGLYWEYPPGYSPWSYLSILVYHFFTGKQIPSWESLIYVEAFFQNPYSAWRALHGLNLYLLYFLVKVPFVISFFWIAGIIERESGKVPWKTWLLNPFAVIIGILWGQLDVLALAFMMQSIVYFRKDRNILATAFAGIGALIKPFPVFIIPYLIFRARRKSYSLIGLAIPVAIGLLLYLLAGNFTADLKTIILGRSASTYLGIFSSNGLTWQMAASYLGLIHFPSLFDFAFIPGYVLLSFFAIRRKIPVYSYFLLSMLLFFLTYNLVNPQYIVWIVAAFIMLGIERRIFLVSALGSIYIGLSYSYTYFLNPDISWNYGASFLGQIEQLRISFTASSIVLVAIGIVSSFIFAVEMFREIRRLRNWQEIKSG